jgi:hypothetical protein
MCQRAANKPETFQTVAPLTCQEATFMSNVLLKKLKIKAKKPSKLDDFKK